MAQHVFIVMPFGVKEGIDFNSVYRDLIKPALLDVGLEPFRADEDILPGDIRADMFQELLMADLVVADLSINNANAWYELGVRHGLRARGIVQIRSGSDKIPFDVCVDRTLHYHLQDGAPDPAFLKEDRALLGKVALETLQSQRSRPSSPVYQYLPNLQEPDWKSLRVKNADGFWRKHEQWESRVEVARKNNRPGDILVLADEAPSYALKLEGYRTAGNALMSVGQFAYALEQFEKALAIEPDDLACAQKKGIALGRLGKTALAGQWFKDLSDKHPRDAETWALLGRLEKERWIGLWRKEGVGKDVMKDDAACESEQLKEAIRAYRQGFIEQPESYYAGINALTLSFLLRYLLDENKDDEELTAMIGGVRWAVTSELTRETSNKKNYWARVTLADLEVLVGDEKTVDKAYKYAVAAARDDWFALDSSRQQLRLLQALDFRPEPVSAAINVFDKALAALEKPESSRPPRKVFLFSGHMVDAAGRTAPRFPAAKEKDAINAIAKQLAALEAGPDDLAMCGGACGGDLIFAEACLRHGLQLQIRIPFAVPEFLEKSVSFAGDNWRDRYFAVQHHPNTRLFVMPDELGELPHNTNPYERNNLWQLYSAISWGAEKVYFICLWDGKGGDGPGGTRQMHDTVKQRAGRVYVLDTHTLFNIPSTGDSL
ncbi:TRAFs-binding domain-containing protein [Methylomicrobium sp. Wu6]|uniref:TRAFs-binding domain-containing protein n=1 Tax=Methylomicrobium sp. Wu6 TaxID=3107928 RepID=UPI002DD61C73|nr:TRAFs-binding domain-containing protein [Methylomicrobium sp. Wu6]MEC4750466.1 TRAFs-binding domain-containing protein [Methylomicrobium sp. Wu6]